MRIRTRSRVCLKGCRALAVLFSLALWLAPSAAFAATTYHAAPAGSGTTCSEAAPCQASVALTLATAGDTVMLAANQGTYGTAGVPSPPRSSCRQASP